VRRARGQELGVVLANVLRLHLEHSQAIDTARWTASPALESRSVQYVQPARFSSDVRAQCGDRVGSSTSPDPASRHGRHHTLRDGMTGQDRTDAALVAYADSRCRRFRTASRAEFAVFRCSRRTCA
jgi:hypothetical protein